MIMGRHFREKRNEGDASSKTSAKGLRKGRNERSSLSRPAPAIVHEVLDSPGQPLDSQSRSLFEPRFHHDFSRVQVHTDDKAAESAKAVNALAYTAGQDIVFNHSQYRPNSAEGRRLLAHELAHAVQQRGQGTTPHTLENSNLALGSPDHSSEREAASATRIADYGWNPSVSFSRESTPVVRRAGLDDIKWGPEYDKPESRTHKSYETYRGELGEVRATTKGGLSRNPGRFAPDRQGAGTPAREITMPMLLKIYPGLAKDVAADPAKATKAQLYLDKLNEAFKIMKIDTAEAQALYLAHASGEAGEFRAFVETQGSIDEGAQKWMDDPTKAKLDTKHLARYPKGGSVNPGGNFEFIGRGPVQVTHEHQYVETLAMLDRTAAQYAAAGDKKSEAQVLEAAAAIKRDPKQAANPKYAFLFSAAFMKKHGVDVGAAWIDPNKEWTGEDTASGWVAGGALDSVSREALGKKQKSFQRIRQALIDETKKP